MGRNGRLQSSGLPPERSAVVSTNGVFAFKGVPYGAPTADSMRFLPPAKPQSWIGIRGTLELGSANFTVYDGANLAAKHDVVLVGGNHRLNIFGFLYLAAISSNTGR